jgi:hypothetical protein
MKFKLFNKKRCCICNKKARYNHKSIFGQIYFPLCKTRFNKTLPALDYDIICECGNDKFLFFEYSKCPSCLNEYKLTKTGKIKELWFRRLNLENNSYGNWEHY